MRAEHRGVLRKSGVGGSRGGLSQTGTGEAQIRIRCGEMNGGLGRVAMPRTPVPEPERPPLPSRAAMGAYKRGHSSGDTANPKHLPRGPFKGEWLPEDEVLVAMVPFSIKKDLPEGQRVWPEIVEEIKGLLARSP